MKYTTNYRLKKPEGPDIVNIDDLNENADIIDQKLKKLEDGVYNAPPNSVSDAAIGSRTPDQSQAPTSPGTGTLTQLISWLANRIKAITGKTNWWDDPPTTLQAAKTHMDATSGIHGATSSATANRIIIRDSAGRAKVAAPSASDDIARKAEVDAVSSALNTHKSSADHDGRYYTKTAIDQMLQNRSSVAVITGVASHGELIPLPPGYSANQCHILVSIRYMWFQGWDRDTVASISCYVDSQRRLFCRATDFRGRNIPGTANYMVIGIK